MVELLCSCPLSDLILVGAESSETGLMLAYVGPAGIGALGILLAVGAVVLIGAVGLVLHPIRLLLRYRRQKQQKEGIGAPEVTSAAGSEENHQS